MPAVGASAPDFTLRSAHGESIGLADVAGAPALLVFFPWAFSGICTGELQGLRDRHAEIVDAGVRLLAISVDAMFTLRVFAETESLPFDLLSDFWPHGAVAQAYGVFDDTAGCALRGSFLLDADGVVRWSLVQGIGEPRDVEAHVEAVRTLAASR